MKVIYGIGNINKVFKNPVVTIGIFDGVHLGHRFIIKKAIEQAKKINGTSIVMTFFPHPNHILKPKKYLPFLVSLNHRIKFIKQLAPDFVIVIEFTESFSRLSPEEFVKRFIVDRIKPKIVLVGSDFTFGRNRRGDIYQLKKFGKKYNFLTEIIPPVKIGKRVASSTLIRKLIRQGNLFRAKKLLGKPVTILGKVISGKRMGAILGFPTANIHYYNEIIPPKGVYAVKVIYKGKYLPAMANIGIKPSFEGVARKINLEVHLFNFKKNIYGKELEIEFYKKIREEKRFATRSSLRERLKKDEMIIKKFFKI